MKKKKKNRAKKDKRRGKKFFISTQNEKGKFGIKGLKVGVFSGKKKNSKLYALFGENGASGGGGKKNAKICWGGEEKILWEGNQ